MCANELPLLQVIVFGSSGNLGAAIARALAQSKAGSAGLPTRAEFAAGPSAVLSRILSQSRADPALPVTWIFAAGLTDPSQHPETLLESNYALPMRWIEALARERAQDRIVTFGTLLENFDEIVKTNAYAASKYRLGEAMRARAKPGQIIHLQLHTLYGGVPRPHLFLGQMIQSLRDHSPFRMTSGRQLREYHAVDDVAQFIVNGVRQGFPPESVALLSSGAPVTLGELARHVFGGCDRLDLLHLGDLSEPEAENWNRSFAQSPESWGLPIRDSKAGVLDYVRTQLLRR